MTVIRPAVAIFTLSLLAVFDVQAKPLDPAALARFDAGYARCEQKFEQMRGHADEAYLGVYKLKVDEKNRGRLAELRKKPAYAAEKAKADKRLRKPSAEVDKKLDQQCQATWGQVQAGK